MDYLTQKRYTFKSAALAADTFGVVEFRGREGLSQCYEFQALLVSDNAEIDLAQVIGSPATFSSRRMDGRTIEYHGAVFQFEQLHAVDRCAFYRVRLAPKLSWLSLIRQSQVFLGRSVPEIIAACLKDGGLTGQDYEFRLKGSYPALEYVCQYDESHLDFISRWMEREGIYYWFEQGAEREKVVFTDTKISHAAHPHGGAVSYAPPSALETFHSEEVVREFNCRCRQLPASVQVRDYNYRKPSLEVAGTAEVDGRGRGQAYHYGEHSLTPDEAKRMARLYAEMLYCRREVFEGEGAVPHLSAGSTVELKAHFRKSYNQEYLVTEVRHEGSQAGYLLAGLAQGVAGGADSRVYYRNSFTAIRAGVQYRPERRTARPKVAGTLTARVDAAGSGQYAELDERGRYKVVLPFDLSGRRDGKASAWFRMATPYAGADHGMHFPLHKGTEVLLTFQDGDPDRPVIAAAVPNAETPSPVTGENQTASEIRTGSGNRIHIEDAAGSERILLHAPKQSSFIRVGATNDPPPGDDQKVKTYDFGIAAKTEGFIDIQAQARNEVILGESTDWVAGLRMWFTFALGTDGVLGGKYDFQWPAVLELSNLRHDTSAEEFRAQVNAIVTRTVNDEINATEQRIAQQITQVIGEKLTALASDTDLVVQNQTTTAQTVQTVGEGVQAEILSIHTLSNQIDTVGQHLKTIGTDLKTVGTAMRETVVLNANVGVLIENAGTKTTSSGTITQTAGAIFIN